MSQEKSFKAPQLGNRIPKLGGSKVFVGLSGGVDSSVSAALLKQATPNNFQKLFGRPTPKGFRGYDVTGVFIRVWQPDWIECTWKEDRLDAMRICAKLGIPFHTLNLEKEYKKEVADYMIREYKMGRTPNPDVMCNKHVKFGGFYNWAMKQGADFVATGHYARIGCSVKREADSKIEKAGPNLNPNRYTLNASFDSNKDQSYFLWQIKREQLSHILFPIGNIEKPEVRKLAKKFGLITANKKDSQGLCFLGKIDVKEFLKKYIKPKVGKVLNEEGEVIGNHDGAIFLTLGERHGFNVTTKSPDDKPYYVVSKDLKKNVVGVSNDPKTSLNGDSRKVFNVSEVNWIGPAPVAGAGLSARLRYRQPLQACTIKYSKPGFEYFQVVTCPRPGLGQLQVIFEDAQSGGAPGQSIVFYDKDKCLGGGIIV